MSALNEYSICKVATVTGVNMASTAKAILYTVPPGKSFYPWAVCVRKASSIMGTEYNFGTDASATTWVNSVDLANIAASTQHRFITPNYHAVGIGTYPDCAAGSEFGIKGVTVAASACTASMDVFGFLT